MPGSESSARAAVLAQPRPRVPRRVATSRWHAFLGVCVALTLALAACTPGGATPSPTPTPTPMQPWKLRLSDPKADYFSTLALARDDTIFTVRYSGEVGHLVKSFAPDGAPGWETLLKGGFAVPRDIKVAPDGTIVLAGWTEPEEHAGDARYHNAYLAKLSPQGEVLWEKSLGGPEQDEFNGVAVSADGSITAVGFTCSTTGDFPAPPIAHAPDPELCEAALAVSFSPDGDQRWAKIYGGSFSSMFGQADAAPDGSIVTNGQNLSDDGDLPVWPGLNDDGTVTPIEFVTKLTPDGSIVWSTPVDQKSGGRLHDVVVDPAGAILAAGRKNNKAEVMKLSADGAIVWTVSVDGVVDSTMNTFPREIALTADGGAVAVGQGAPPGGGATFRGLVMRVTSDGRLAWVKLYGTAVSFHAVAETTDGAVIVAGGAETLDDFPANGPLPTTPTATVPLDPPTGRESDSVIARLSSEGELAAD